MASTGLQGAFSAVPTTSDYTIVYDISDDRERRRVDALLKGWGFRVQKSVFECRLGRGERQRLARALQSLDIQSGTVRIYRIVEQSTLRIGCADQKDVARATAYVF